MYLLNKKYSGFWVEPAWRPNGLLVFRIMLWLIMITPVDAIAQNKFFAFSGAGRDGVSTAKLSTQVGQLYSENEKRISEIAANGASITVTASELDSVSTTLSTSSQCGAAGQIFGPGHAQSVGDCVSSFTANADGSVTFSGGAIFGNAGLCDSTTEGALRYSSAVKRFEFCDGSSWQGMGTGTACDFNFPDITNADPNTVYDSANAVYSGEGATASLSGGTGSIKKNDANTGNVSGVTIYPGNTVGIRGTASSQFNQVTAFTLDIGSYSGCWKISTKEQDATPDAFVLNALTGQELSTIVTSNTVMLTGFDGPLAASVSGQGSVEMSINSGNWGTGGAVNPGDTVQLRMTTDSNYETTFLASLSVGTSSVAWSVETRPDCTPGSQTWNTPGTHTYTPVGCTTFDIQVVGGQGGSGGGKGGESHFRYVSTDGFSFSILVGGGSGNVTGGGGYGYGSGHGGGASALKYGSTLLAVSGGGGGNGTLNSSAGDGAGGNNLGGNATCNAGGKGGGSNSGGSRGNANSGHYGGNGGSNGGNGMPDFRGSVGGTGIPEFSVSGGGSGMRNGGNSGGGGGGYGGGGGGSLWDGSCWASGGGGGGYINTGVVSNINVPSSTNTGNGYVTISWSP
jgi:hypothetical protein